MLANGWTWIGFLIFFVLTSNAKADVVTIFDVRNTLPLSNAEPLFRDYYINAGSERGLRAGMIVTVRRKMALYDSYRNKSPGDLHIQVGKVKIILVQDGLAVARDHAAISRTTHPLLEYDFVMAGDELDLATVAPDTESNKTGDAAEVSAEKVVDAVQSQPTLKGAIEPRVPAQTPPKGDSIVSPDAPSSPSSASPGSAEPTPPSPDSQEQVRASEITVPTPVSATPVASPMRRETPVVVPAETSGIQAKPAQEVLQSGNSVI